MRTREHRQHRPPSARAEAPALPFAPILAFLVVLAAFALSIVPLHAASFDVHAGDDLNIVVVTDEIMPGDDDRFHAAVAEATANGENALIVLASPGGALGAGMHMGLIIAESGLPTFVPEGEVCASACALAWLAGEPRMMTTASEIGFHQPYDEREGRMVPSIEANAVVGHYIATIGMGPQIVSFAVSAPPDRMAWLELAYAAEIGLDVTEVEASDAPIAAAPRDVAGLDRRVPPTDESASPTAYVPLPVMRALTPTEVASLELAGTTDGAAEAGLGLPLVTTLGTGEAGGVPLPWGLRVALGADVLAQPTLAQPTDDFAPEFDVMTDGEMIADLNDDIATEIVHDIAVATPVHLPASDMRNVESAVLDAVRRFGTGGADALRHGSAACWSDMRDLPTAARLQYCHVFDLVAADMVEQDAANDFAPFAVAVRLRTHRAMVADDAIPSDFADLWGAEASMVVAAMVDG